MSKFKAFLLEFWEDESGISSVEYALLLAFLAGSIIIAAGELSAAIEADMQGAVGSEKS